MTTCVFPFVTSASGTCSCPAGFILSGTTCTRCPVNTYSSSVDSLICSPTPINAILLPDQSGFTCLSGYISIGTACQANASHPDQLYISDVIRGVQIARGHTTCEGCPPTDQYCCALKSVDNASIAQMTYPTNTVQDISGILVPTALLLNGTTGTASFSSNVYVKPGQGLSFSKFVPDALNTTFHVESIDSSNTLITFSTNIQGPVTTIGIIEVHALPMNLLSNLADCLDSSTCNFVGYDFNTDTASKFTSVPYTVDTSQTVGSDYSVFSKHGKPVSMNSPPGFAYSYNLQPYTNGVANSSAITIDACATVCRNDSLCTAFNFINLTNECSIVHTNPPVLDTGSQNAIGYMKEHFLVNTNTHTNGTTLDYEGNFCENYTACNADMTSLVNSGISGFSTTEITSCAYCPVRSYSTTVGVVNELGTNPASTWQNTLLFKENGSDPSPLLIPGKIYNISNWHASVRFNGALIYMVTPSNFICLNQDGTILASFPNDTYTMNRIPFDTSAVHYIEQVHYVTNGYVFNDSKTGGIVTYSTKPLSGSCSTGGVLKTFPPERRGNAYFRPPSVCQGIFIKENIAKGTTDFSEAIFILDAVSIEDVVTYFGNIFVKKYITDQAGISWNISFGAPNLINPIMTNLPVSISIPTNIITLPMSPAGLISIGDIIHIYSENTPGFFVVTAVNFDSIIVNPVDTTAFIMGDIPQFTVVETALVAKSFPISNGVNLLDWYKDVDATWTSLTIDNNVASILLLRCYNAGTMPDPYEELGLFRTYPIPPASTAQWTLHGCNFGCTDNGFGRYLLYNCYTDTGASCDTNNGAILTGLACRGRNNACVPDKAVLLSTFSPQLTNMLAIDVTRVDSTSLGYYGLQHSGGNRTDINTTQWSFIYQIISENGINRHVTISNPEKYFLPCTIARLANQTTGLVIEGTAGSINSFTGCSPGYGPKILRLLEFCEICLAGSYSPGGRGACITCDQGNYCPQGSVSQTPCPAGFYCQTPKIKLACPLGFYCPSGTDIPKSCDTEILDGTSLQLTGITMPTIDGSYNITINKTASFVPGAVAGLAGIIVGPMIYVSGGNKFSLVNHQSLNYNAPVPPLIYQTVAHYCPVSSSMFSTCAGGSYCPLSSLQLACPDATYCPSTGVFVPVPCPTCPGQYYDTSQGKCVAACTGVNCSQGGLFYKAPNINTVAGAAFGQRNSIATTCFACPPGSSVNSDKNGCVCSDPNTTWSSQEESCIGNCPAGKEPTGTNSACVACPDNHYSPGVGIAACIPCPKNFTSTHNADRSGCICSNPRIDNLVVNGIISWDAGTNRCYVARCNNTSYVIRESNCISPTTNAIYSTLGNQMLANGPASYCTTEYNIANDPLDFNANPYNYAGPWKNIVGTANTTFIYPPTNVYSYRVQPFIDFPLFPISNVCLSRTITTGAPKLLYGNFTYSRTITYTPLPVGYAESTIFTGFTKTGNGGIGGPTLYMSCPSGTELIGLKPNFSTLYDGTSQYDPQYWGGRVPWYAIFNLADLLGDFVEQMTYFFTKIPIVRSNGSGLTITGSTAYTTAPMGTYTPGAKVQCVVKKTACPTYYALTSPETATTLTNNLFNIPNPPNCTIDNNVAPRSLYGHDGKTPQPGLTAALNAVALNASLKDTYFTNFDGVSFCRPGINCDTQLPCPAGYYCLGGLAIAVPCPTGYYCPAGTSVPIACTSGKFCPPSSSTNSPCPAGYYCPTPYQKLACLPGTKSSSTGQTSISTCSACSGAGTYCPAGSSAQVTCSAGDYCPDGKTKYDCPAGNFCPTPSIQLPCPAGAICPARTSTNFASTLSTCTDQTKTIDYTTNTCIACPNPRDDYIWDPRRATSSAPVSFVLQNSRWVDTTFTNISGSTFNIGDNIKIKYLTNLSMTGTVKSSQNQTLTIIITSISLSLSTVITPSQGNVFIIVPSGCDTVIPCNELGKSPSTDFKTCQVCPIPAAGYIWTGLTGCNAVFPCFKHETPSADNKSCIPCTPPIDGYRYADSTSCTTVACPIGQNHSSDLETCEPCPVTVLSGFTFSGVCNVVRCTEPDVNQYVTAICTPSSDTKIASCSKTGFSSGSSTTLGVC